MKYIIIGNGAAGLNSALSIRANDKISEIVLICKERHLTYGRPMISYYLKNKIDLDKLPIFDESFYKEKCINIVYDQAIEIDRFKKRVYLLSNMELEYDKLILATGSEPFIPPIGNYNNQDNIFTFLDLDSAIELKKTIKAGDRVVILGGGLIAMKAAEGLKGLSDDISVVELADRILPTILNGECSNKVKQHIQEKGGIKFYLSNTIVELEGKNRVNSVTLKDGVKLGVDVLIIAVGVRPQLELAKSAGLKINRGLVVDKHMRTSDENIYGAGDIIEIRDMLDNQIKTIALWPNAVKSGRVAGSNASGVCMEYDKTFAYNAIDFFGLRMITGGIINPDDTYDIISYQDESGLSEFIVSGNKLRGFILLGNVERAGLYTEIIRNEYDLSEFDDILKKREYLSYNRELRALKYRGLD